MENRITVKQKMLWKLRGLKLEVVSWRDWEMSKEVTMLLEAKLLLIPLRVRLIQRNVKFFKMVEGKVGEILILAWNIKKLKLQNIKLRWICKKQKGGFTVQNTSGKEREIIGERQQLSGIRSKVNVSNKACQESVKFKGRQSKTVEKGSVGLPNSTFY